ncbi:MAG: dihydrolipoamide acetyltransferase family protein [Fimbriimonadales bacterium]
MIEVIMPKMGDAMEEGTLVEWVKKEGDKVKSGDIIGNIQTDKATVELTSPSSGILTGFLISEGDTVPVGRAIAAVLKEGETLPDGWKSGGAPKSVTTTATQIPEKPQTRETSTQVMTPSATTAIATGQRVFISPLAKRLASEAGLNVATLRGTGPNGRIVERDIRAALTQAPVSVATTQPSIPRGATTEVALNPLRRITAQRTAQSKQQVPHYYVTVEVNLDRLEEVRRQMKADDPDTKISINDFIVKACALALVEQPHINASFQDGKEIRHGSVNIGVAVAVPDGLTMPVVKDCQTKSLRQMAGEVRELAGRARENKLSLDELSDSTFAISNMGMFDVENFAAIINQPNGAIVAVSSASRRPIVADEDGEEIIQVATIMKMTGSFDHRIIDGAVGAQFMGAVRKLLEAPTKLLS